MQATDRAALYLKHYYGYDSFRPGQKELVGAALSGRDFLGILPTGGGKSICYQLPALLMGGISLIISPLISLMEDQVSALKKRGIRAASLTSGMRRAEKLAVLKEAARLTEDGQPFLLYVSPERLGTSDFRAFSARARIRFLCIDEAHCISAWGQDFRPAYLKIRDFLESLPVRPVTAAVTATASPRVRSDILSFSGLVQPYVYISSFDRPNLYFELRRPRDRHAELLRLLRAYRGRSGIIYCLTRRTVDAIASDLAARAIPAARCHAGMRERERLHEQEEWLRDRKPVMVATTAFGMGIDKPDVRFVIHYGMPSTVEDYYQEAGRAGRDGKRADCILLIGGRDALIGRFFLSQLPRGGKRKIREEQLAAMRAYAGGQQCLRRFLLQYFGEDVQVSSCGSCSVCLKRTKPRPSFQKGVCDPELRKALLMIRLQIAEEKHTLPVRVLPDEAIEDLAALRPVTLADLLLMERVPFLKGMQYGAEFLTEIRAAVSSCDSG